MESDESDDSENEDENISVGSTDVGCNVKGEDKMFDGPTGKKFRVNCPKSCADGFYIVSGTMIYSDDSVICSAAFHSGLVDSDKGGAVILVIANG